MIMIKIYLMLILILEFEMTPLGQSFKWVTKNTEDFFKNKGHSFSLPGAFTPTCSTYQLPDFDKLYDDFKEIGIDEIYCI